VLIDRFLDMPLKSMWTRFPTAKTLVVAGSWSTLKKPGFTAGTVRACFLPFPLNPGVVERIKEQTRSLARELKVVGLMNIQYAVKDDLIYVSKSTPGPLERFRL